MEAKWIPVKWHQMTEEEATKKDYPYSSNWCVFDCEMPEDGQEVFVTVRYSSERNVVIHDYCTIDYDENTYYLDHGWDWYQDAIAWMPVELPEPYKEE